MFCINYRLWGRVRLEKLAGSSHGQETIRLNWDSKDTYWLESATCPVLESAESGPRHLTLITVIFKNQFSTTYKTLVYALYKPVGQCR